MKEVFVKNEPGNPVVIRMTAQAAVDFVTELDAWDLLPWNVSYVLRKEIKRRVYLPRNNECHTRPMEIA